MKFHLTDFVKQILLAAFSLGVFSGCASFNSPPNKQTPSVAARNEGYALLYELISKQKDVSKILIIKKEKSDFHNLIKTIGETSKQMAQQLETFAKKDPQLNLKLKNLPLLEQKTRAAIEKTDSKELLLAKKRDFELRLLLTQIESSRYASHLAKTVGENETQPERKAWLAQTAQRGETLHGQILNLIASRYVRDF